MRVFRRICGQNGGLVVLLVQTHSRARVLARSRCVGLTAWTPASAHAGPASSWFSLKEVWVG